MKKFKSRWELIQRLSEQRRKLAEIEVLRARTAVAHVAEEELALQQKLRCDAREFADLTNSPVPAHLLVACRLVTARHTEQLLALHTRREQHQQELHATLTTWKQRSVEVDQTDQMTQRERQVYDAEAQAAEQLEIDEHSMALRRTQEPRREEKS